MNLRDRFLDILKRNREPLTIYICSGVKLTGFISDYDDTGVTLERTGTFQFIERQAISTYFPDHGELVSEKMKGGDNVPF